MNDARPIALITGASRGIGLAIARDLARTHRIVAGARTEAGLDELRRAVPDLVPFVADLADEAATERAVAGLPAGVGERLDVLVHSAGLGDERRLEEYARADWRRLFEVNVFAVADLTRLLLPALRAAKGTIVFLNSGSGLRSYPRGTLYTGTKWALRTLAESLREEVRADGIRVVSLHPGWVETELGLQAREQHGLPHGGPDTWIQPETLAAAVRLAVDAPQGTVFEAIAIRSIENPPKE